LCVREAVYQLVSQSRRARAVRVDERSLGLTCVRVCVCVVVEAARRREALCAPSSAAFPGVRAADAPDADADLFFSRRARSRPPS
jgi:hypothetical protein